MAKTILLPDNVTDTYKKTSIAIKKIDISNKHVIKKSLVEIMKQSFFHGSSLYGTNFIA